MAYRTRVSVINVNRADRQWNVNVNRLDNDNRWNAENRFFSRNSLIFSCLIAGVFLFKESFPTRKLSTDSIKLLGYKYICFFFQVSIFPRYLKNELENVEFHDCHS